MHGPDLLAQADQTRHMMDRTVAERTVTSTQVDRIDHMVRLHAHACVTMPPLVMLRHASIFLGYGKKIFAAIPEKYSNRRSVSQYRAALAESRQTIGAM
ncbi:MAG: hypothetical protein WCF33_14655 [Pseudonocardiaceae bacterium]